jgi:UDP-N-acetylmuramoyl-tripeptide--D-alanyl-D-alanine ligase
MNAFESAMLACLGVAALLAGARWVRVAQREHYVIGATSRFALRWWAMLPENATLGALALVGAATTIAFRWPALVVAAVVAIGPIGLGLRGRTSPLRWTRRCVLLALTASALAVGCVGVVATLAGGRAGLFAACLAALGVPGLVDGALWILSPFEELVAERFVNKARERLSRVHPQVVAITGSYGKTTTKGYIAHLLAARFSVLASPRSFNNRGGLSRTVNEQLALGTEVLVVEMGTYGPGEIRALCSWLEPRVAVLTAVGPVHLERFKRIEAILEAKAEITEGAEVVVCNVDDERLAALAGRLEGEGKRVIRCSAGGPGAAKAEVLVDEEGEEEVALFLHGERIGAAPIAPSAARGTRSNVACAIGAALALGCEAKEVLGRLEGLPGADNRLEIARSSTGLYVLDDTFNSNPAGARVALAALAASGDDGKRRVVVTPGMVELGPLQVSENAAFAKAAAAFASDVVVVGRTNRRALLSGLAAAREAGEGQPQVVVVRRRQDAVAWVRRELGAGDAVLYENDLPDHFP